MSRYRTIKSSGRTGTLTRPQVRRIIREVREKRMENEKLSRNFHASEFDCKCGKCDTITHGKYGGDCMNVRFLQELQIVRDEYTKPIQITSGIRCPEWNEHEGGSKTSSHLFGYAADIYCEDLMDRFLLLGAIMSGASAIVRVGIGKDFIHVDMDPNKVPYVVWVY